MRWDDRVLAGLLLAFGAAQFLVMMMLLEATAPGYSMHDNAISDLGTIPETEAWFTLTLFLIGILNVLVGYFLYRVWKSKALLLVFILGGIGGMGAALIPLDNPTGLHGLFALVAFLFMNLEAILVGLRLKGSTRFASFLTDAIGLVFLVVMVLVDSGSLVVASIGHGGVERMIAYPVLLWMVLFGGYLLAKPSLAKAE